MPKSLKAVGPKKSSMNTTSDMKGKTASNSNALTKNSHIDAKSREEGRDSSESRSLNSHSQLILENQQLG